jgi:hypothetical protein
VERVRSLVRAGEGCFYTTTVLRGWVIIVEGGNSGCLPVCVQQCTYYRHSDGNAALYYTHLHKVFPSSLSAVSFLNVCIHTSTQL